MASPQVENGFTRIANELLEELVGTNISGRQMRILLCVLRLTYGYGKKSDDISYGEIAKNTNILRREVIRDINSLVSKNMLFRCHNGARMKPTIGVVKDYSRWLADGGKATTSGMVDPSGKGTTISSGKVTTTLVVRVPPLPSGKVTTLQRKVLKKVLKKERKGPVEDHEKRSSTAPPSTAFLDPVKTQCPHHDIVTLYHDICKTLPTVREWTAARQSLLRARWSESAERQDLEWWKGFFAKVAESDFLMGRSKEWRADMEWLIRPRNFVKVIEGHYENRHKTASEVQREAFLKRFQGRSEDAN